MATLTATDMTGSGQRAVTWNTLTASDTFTYTESKNQVLIINNDTAGALTPNIDGDEADATFPVKGVGEIDLSAGLTMDSIGIGASAAIPLNTIKQYLQGTIAMTGGDGATCALLEF